MSSQARMDGKAVIWKQSIRGCGLDKPFRLQLPAGAEIIRAGIEPGPGTPAFWFTCDPTHEDKEEHRR